MPRTLIRNAHGVPFLILKGFFVVRTRQMPDGDTMHFAAAAKYKKNGVNTNVPVAASGNKSVACRLQSIDAPEKTQPMGAKSRNALLRHLGFDPDDLGLGDDDFYAAEGITTRPGWLVTHDLDNDRNKRPLSYLFRANPGGFKHGKQIPAEEVLSVIKESANYYLASRGWAFPAFYENTDETHAEVFKKAAVAARDGKKPRGVWASDETVEGFKPDKDALGPAGALVYPKFYRRVEKYKAPKPTADSFINWLKKQADGKKLVEGAGPQPVALWKLFEKVSAKKVAVPYDVTKLWFRE